MDFIFIRDLSVRAIVGRDVWGRSQPQPILLSIFANKDIREAGAGDILAKSLNYDVLSRKLAKAIHEKTFNSIQHVANDVAHAVLEGVDDISAKVHVRMPESLLRGESSEVVINRYLKNSELLKVDGTSDVLKLNKLALTTIIGVNHAERLHRQNVVLDIVAHLDPKEQFKTEKNAIYNQTTISDRLAQFVESANFLTIEALASSIAQVVLEGGVHKVDVSAGKPSALTFAKLAGARVLRDQSDRDDAAYAKLGKQINTNTQTVLFPQTEAEPSTDVHRVYLAIGSNMGNQLANIELTITLLGEAGVSVKRTSSLYVSAPMYVKDQEKFLNGVLYCETRLSPTDLLKVIKNIEYKKLGRVKEMDNGPRTIDVDILLYDSVVLNSPELTIPHIDMLNRSFVLEPLVDISSADHIHPLTAEPFESHMNQLPDSTESQISSQMVQMLSMAPHGAKRRVLNVDPRHKSARTLIMAVLNATPDSFSDGGATTINNVLERAIAAVENGADIIDIGGLSTRPGAEPISEMEELDRVIPVIEMLRADERLDSTPISIDTYRSNVAERAILAGADMINDVFAGQKDASIFDVARRYKAPIVLSHARGDPKTMNKLNNYDKAGVIKEVGEELKCSVEKAFASGLHRWQIILDPGIGFAKNFEQNLEIIRHLGDLRSQAGLQGLPWLVGPSRKGFIGKITHVEQADQRVVGTAAAVVALIQQGADIVRVHDTKAIKEAVRIADALYRESY